MEASRKYKHLEIILITDENMYYLEYRYALGSMYSH